MAVARGLNGVEAAEGSDGRRLGRADLRIIRTSRLPLCDSAFLPANCICLIIQYLRKRSQSSE